MSRAFLNSRGWIASAMLLATVVATGAGLAVWKYTDITADEAAAATDRAYRPTTTSIGTVLATRWITLRNELAGTVSRVQLISGQVVGAGTVLVALDVSVEQAELQAQQAQAELAQTTLDRLANL